ncbi:MAG: DUF2889 domain-containing protein [Solirubrobacterales bacterium]
MYHSTMFCRVNRSEDDVLNAECTWLANDHEMTAWLVTGVRDLRIRKAGWAAYRSPGKAVGVFELPELVGCEAYLFSGPDLKRVFGRPGLEAQRELVSECIRGIVQAETFFFTERGFASALDYDAFWDKMYVNGCTYYSHLDQIEKPWMEFAGNPERQLNLFNRVKTATVRPGEMMTEVSAVFMDSFHELGVRIELDRNGAIAGITGDYVSAPDKICWRNLDHLPRFAGVRLMDLGKKEIAGIAGGAHGCHHLVDLIHEAARAVKAAGV